MEFRNCIVAHEAFTRNIVTHLKAAIVGHSGQPLAKRFGACFKWV
jgi:hypothetical protein